MNEEIEKEYQDFYLKFLNKTRELQEDFNKLSDINKYKFEKNINILLKTEFPNLLKFLQKWFFKSTHKPKSKLKFDLGFIVFL